MNGLLLVDKPAGCTSHDVVLELRRILGEPRLGHFGTLDPMATGLLVAALGKATRLFPFFSKEEKTYQGCIRLGQATDTYDAQGRPVGPLTVDLPQEAVVTRAMAKFQGPVPQVPPAFSAKKYQGKPLYRMARSGAGVPRTASLVVIHHFLLVGYRPPDLDFEVSCSSGTYVRSLAHDLGQDLGCGAHLSRLRRTRSGSFRVEDSLTLEKIGHSASLGQAHTLVIPLPDVLKSYPRITLGDSESRRARHGQPIPFDPSKEIAAEAVAPQAVAPGAGRVFRIFDQEGCLIVLARLEADKNVLQPFIVLV